MAQPSYRSLSQRCRKIEGQIRAIKRSLNPKSPWPSIKYPKYEIKLRKCIVNPEWNSKTVITDSPCAYVDNFLNKVGPKRALFYWTQASSFSEASKNLSLVSRPLTLYYCFLNATKALLVARGIHFDEAHGVTGPARDTGPSNLQRLHLQNENVILKPRGVLSGLCDYLKETVSPDEEQYSLKDILYNLQYIHRSCVLTYRRMPEIFIPICNSRFVYDKSTNKAWLEIELERKHSNKKTLNRLKHYSIDSRYDDYDYYILRHDESFEWYAPRNIPTAASLKNLSDYYFKVRKQFVYICPFDTWYVKTIRHGIINKGTLPLTYAAMHWLSELSRYEPEKMMKYLESKYGWLLSEFIETSLEQFIDQICSEITKYDFVPTSFR